MFYNMKKEWKDISVTLYNGMAGWPGDEKFNMERTFEIGKGSACNVSKYTMSSHAGTHIDPPYHFLPDGISLDKMEISSTVGPARVIEIQDRESVKPAELAKHRIRRGERLLFKTVNSEKCWKTREFVKDFVHISPEAATLIAQTGVLAIGIDYLSAGGYENNGDLTHMKLMERGVWIIEGLDLSGISPGKYEMICLPLKILNSDGAPARAIIRKL